MNMFNNLNTYKQPTCLILLKLNLLKKLSNKNKFVIITYFLIKLIIYVNSLELLKYYKLYFKILEIPKVFLY